jgi:hypothetical protein
MTTVHPNPTDEHTQFVRLDVQEVGKRVKAEQVCAKRILEIQESMFGSPPSSARVKFRNLVEMFDMLEWLDLQEVLENPLVVPPEVSSTSIVVVGDPGPSHLWLSVWFIDCH